VYSKAQFSKAYFSIHFRQIFNAKNASFLLLLVEFFGHMIPLQALVHSKKGVIQGK